MESTMHSPCTCCQRVADPNKCDNKDCMRWRKWFIGRWEQMRKANLPKEGKA